MDSLSADLSTLLRINKGFPIQVTYKGNDAVVYQHALSNYFTQNAVTWKRQGKFFPYPLVFPLKFVPFDEKLVFTVDSTTDDLKNFAFLHVFFINAASADEYRNNIRHTVSEWFAGLSSRPELQWLIVIDSTRAKEKKNRSSLMDRIKSDFSKYPHKLIEVSESVEHGSFSSLTSSFQSSLLSHLELLTETWERCLKAGRERYVSKDWNLVDCVNEELDYARLFWSLGALDHALKLYEDLDSFVFFLIVSLSDSDSSQLPLWASRVSEAEIELCPTLIESMKTSHVEKGNHSIAGIRHVILAQKLLLTVQLYNSRLHSPKSGASPGARCDYASVLMKYSNNSLQGVIEHSLLLKSCHSPNRLSVWIIQLVGESFYLSCLLADVNTIETAKEAVASMHMTRFKALLSLSELLIESRMKEKDDLLNWMDRLIEIREKNEKMCKQHRDSALCLLSSSLHNSSSMESLIVRVHDSASSFLGQSERRRTSSYLGYLFAQFLMHSKSSSALPYLLRFVSDLVETGDSSQLVLDAINDVLSRLHPKEDYERIVRFLLYLVQKESNLDSRSETVNRLVEELKRGKNEGLPNIRLNEWKNTIDCPLRATVSTNGKRLKLLPGEKAHLNVSISSTLKGFSFPSARIRVILSTLSPSSSSNTLAFDVEYRLAETRLLCMNKNSVYPSSSSISISGNGQDDKETILEFTHSNDLQLIDNENCTVIVEGITKERGIFVLKSFEISLCNDTLTIVLPPSSISIDMKPLILLVEETKHSVSFPQPKVLEWGVSESIDVILSSGSIPLPQSSLRVTLDDGEALDVEFMSEDGLWESLVVISIDSMEKEKKVEKKIRLCLPLVGDIKDDEVVRKIRFEWCGSVFVHLVRFSPLFSTRFTNSFLENKILLDLELTRSSSSKWLIVPIESTLSIHSSTPFNPILMFFDKQPIRPLGVSSFTWIATPIDSPPSLPFRLQLRYRIESMDGSPLKEGVDREYEYRLEGQLEMKRVQYEVCSQVLSQQPGAQLCRVDSLCHLLVSIRALSINETDSLVITVVADEKFWGIPERTKAFTLKESGLGQVSLMIVPLVAGFLPFPSVQLYPATNSIRSEDRFWGESIECSLGNPLFMFERTAGKQIRVLGASQGEGSISSRGGEKRTIKEKLQKLFD